MKNILEIREALVVSQVGANVPLFDGTTTLARNEASQGNLMTVNAYNYATPAFNTLLTLVRPNLGQSPFLRIGMLMLL